MTAVDAPKRDSVMRLFRKAHRDWPTFLSDSGPAAERAFFALSEDDQHVAAERQGVYVAAVRRTKGKICSFAIYCKERRWEKLPEDDERDAGKASVVLCKPFGPVWAGLRMLRLLKGPVDVEIPADIRQTARSTFERLCEVNDAHAQAYLARKGIRLDDDGAMIFPIDFEGTEYRKRALETGYTEVSRLDRLRGPERAPAWCSVFLELCEAVPVGCEMYERWRSHHAAMVWPFVPDPASMEVVWFPKGGPDGLNEFEAAARAAIGGDRSHNDAA
ncbi:hypothetical protein JVX98_28255 [Ensifer sp. PDNC004]|uniref:hypothetical protein n=1 Tax=Ensifer sp. PDNC004 TaxID=2811423 RepID=UPI0019654DDB|nr:hypothetical protein [Ensifer sp. PDNC004]QRY68184.1 hypothetical protein JVX98_28255 [Ensifer sp. PDNC004]